MIEHPDHNPGLGELPIERRIVRNENYADTPIPALPPGALQQIPGTRPAPPQPPPILPGARDVTRGQAALTDAMQAPIALPPVNYLVQTVFDARPINGADFRYENVIVLDPDGGEGAPTNTWTINFTVPQGRVAILRKITWATINSVAYNYAFVSDEVSPVSNAGAIAVTEPFFLTIAVNGSILPTYEKIYRQSGEENLYSIAASGQIISVTATINSDFGGSRPAGWEPNINVLLYGNLIDTTNREKQYEPANLYQGNILK